MSPGRLINTQADVAEGADWLARQDQHLKRALAATGPLPLRRRPDGFAELLRAIVGQQVSVASARALWSRLEQAGATTPQAVLSLSAEELRALGLSRQKARYAHALADAGIDFHALREVPDAEVIGTLTAVTGIGVWTAEVYAMFSLGRADVFAPGDLALQEAARMIYDMPERPKERALREMAQAWSPWRSVAARLLFTYYRVAKQRDGIT
ncbi:DNA-3-methyladenine glycosylase 2 family protein [uncultured Roseobacter sp.]|uniref:DNA-3-methyladenine glycosylase family protein n=1 Tax=uncultured Roseobacter sp. TaxID=114847 RepID=UPI002605DB5B|nr:DNA-3-methyladenine glycosylase 2 family protein [uncultured Roseobacter sp.]